MSGPNSRAGSSGSTGSNYVVPESNSSVGTSGIPSSYIQGGSFFDAFPFLKALGIDSLWNDLTGKSAANAQMAQQERLLQMQMKWQEDMYNKYYSPTAMAQQQRDAGISIFGNAGNTMGFPSAPAAPNVPDNTHGVANGISALSTLINALTGGQLNVAQARGQFLENAWIDVINDRTVKKLESESYKLVKEGFFTELQADAYREMTPFLVEKSKKELDVMDETINNLKAQSQEAYSKYVVNLSHAEVNLAQVENINEDTNLKKAQQDEIRAKIVDIYEQAYMHHQQGDYYGQAANTEIYKQSNLAANTALTGEQIELTQEQTAGQEIVNQMNEWRSFYQENFNIDPNSDMMQQLVTSSVAGNTKVYDTLRKNARRSELRKNYNFINSAGGMAGNLGAAAIKLLAK